jgi:hypothetical protein
MSKVVDLRALLVRKTLLLCEVGVTGSAKSRFFAIRCVIHAAGSTGRGFTFPRRGDRTGGCHVFTDVRGFDVFECLGVWTSDGGAIGDRLPRGGALRCLWAPKLPKSVLAVSLSPVVFFSPFRFHANVSRMHRSVFPSHSTFPPYQF